MALMACVSLSPSVALCDTTDLPPPPGWTSAVGQVEKDPQVTAQGNKLHAQGYVLSKITTAPAPGGMTEYRWNFKKGTSSAAVVARAKGGKVFSVWTERAKASETLAVPAGRVPLTDADYKLYLRSGKYAAQVDQELKKLGPCYAVSGGYKTQTRGQTVVTVVYKKLDTGRCIDTANATPVLTLVFEGDKLVKATLKGSRTVSIVEDELDEATDPDARGSAIKPPPSAAELKVLNNPRIMNKVVALSAKGYAPLYIKNGAYYLKHRKTGKIVAVR